jgi:hypothetical protein
MKIVVANNSIAAIAPALSPVSVRPRRQVASTIRLIIGSVAAVSASTASRIPEPIASIA